MRTLLLVLLMLGFTSRAAARSPIEPAATAPRDSIAIGIQITPMLDGFVDPWLKAGVRFSAPLGARLGIDVEAGRILGGKTELPDSGEQAVVQIRSFYSSHMRFVRGTRQADGSGRYILAGLQLLTVEGFDHDGVRVVDELSSALLLGLGFDQLFANRTRVVVELGVSGGDAISPYMAIGVQWRLGRN
jgi:hypothetical protein